MLMTFVNIFIHIRRRIIYDAKKRLANLILQKTQNLKMEAPFLNKPQKESGLLSISDSFRIRRAGSH